MRVTDSLLFQTVRYFVADDDAGVAQLAERYARNLAVIAAAVPEIAVGAMRGRLGVLARENGGGAIPITFSICNNFVKSLDK